MRSKLLCLFVAPLFAFGADKGLPRGEASDKNLKVEATAYLDKSSIEKAVAPGMVEGIVAFDVKLTPAAGQKVTINRDDFLLRSDKDGQRSNPYSPTQIAGSSVLTVKTTYSGGGIRSEDRGPVWGGMGGGMPRRMPGQSPGIGNSVSTEAAAASVDPGSGKTKEDPLLAVLKEKILPEKEIDAPVTGQLYFLLEGKHKVKNIELLYKTATGRMSVRFKQE